MKNHKKDLNFELMLVPVIDILSVCICFLLLTVAWIQIGSVNASQSMGGQAQEAKAPPPSIWAYLNKQGQVTLMVKDTMNPFRNIVIEGKSGAISWTSIYGSFQLVHQKFPEIKTALIMPSGESSYSDLIAFMDGLKKNGITDIGVTPL